MKKKQTESERKRGSCEEEIEKNKGRLGGNREERAEKMEEDKNMVEVKTKRIVKRKNE